MNVVWTPRASKQLEAIADYLAEQSPMAAVRVTRRIVAASEQLSLFPVRGRLGRVAGTRELVVPRTSYIVAYRPGADRLDILAVLHGAQDWPDNL